MMTKRKQKVKTPCYWQVSIRQKYWQAKKADWSKVPNSNFSHAKAILDSWRKHHYFPYCFELRKMPWRQQHKVVGFEILQGLGHSVEYKKYWDFYIMSERHAQMAYNSFSIYPEVNIQFPSCMKKSEITCVRKTIHLCCYKSTAMQQTRWKEGGRALKVRAASSRKIGASVNYALSSLSRWQRLVISWPLHAEGR